MSDVKKALADRTLEIMGEVCAAHADEPSSGNRTGWRGRPIEILLYGRKQGGQRREPCGLIRITWPVATENGSSNPNSVASDSRSDTGDQPGHTGAQGVPAPLNEQERPRPLLLVHDLQSRPGPNSIGIDIKPLSQLVHGEHDQPILTLREFLIEGQQERGALQQQVADEQAMEVVTRYEYCDSPWADLLAWVVHDQGDRARMEFIERVQREAGPGRNGHFSLALTHYTSISEGRAA